MPYHMMVTLSEPEKKRVLQDMLDEMPDHATQALMLKLARGLRGTLEPEELGKFSMDLRAAMTPRPEPKHVRALRAIAVTWPTPNNGRNEE